jgi:cell envelope opacity-associated protein A
MSHQSFETAGSVLKLDSLHTESLPKDNFEYEIPNRPNEMKGLIVELLYMTASSHPSSTKQAQTQLVGVQQLVQLQNKNK